MLGGRLLSAFLPSGRMSVCWPFLRSRYCIHFVLCYHGRHFCARDWLVVKTAEQTDVRGGTATVRRAVRFFAHLHQPYEVPEVQKVDDVGEIIELLELQPLADALVFSFWGEARKWVTIGVELTSKPVLTLFLNELTPGLDGQSAWNIIRFLRKLADHEQAILCTIHQPSSLLFESFDWLLLLQRDGKTVSQTATQNSTLTFYIRAGLFR